jgi:hypothetical protein
MNHPNTTPEHDEAQAILEALRQIQDNAELQVEARQNPETLLDRLNLSGIARSAVTLGIAALGVAAVSSPKHLVHPTGFWY